MSLEKCVGGGGREADIFTVDDNIQWRDCEVGGQSIWLVESSFLLESKGM